MRRVVCSSLSTLFLLAACTSAPPPIAAPTLTTTSPVPLPGPELTTIRLGNSAHEADGYAPEFANYLGLYQQYGFDRIESYFFDGDGKGREALIAGQVDAIEGSAATVIASLPTDSPLLCVAIYINKPTDDLVSSPNIKGVDDLKGKTVAISGFGGDAHASVLLSLGVLGLSQNDVTLVPVGGEAARIAALEAHSVDSADVDDSNEDLMRQQGLNILVRLADTPVTLARAGLVVRRDWAASHPNTVRNLIAASMDAQQRMFTQTETAIDGFTRWAQTKNRTDAGKEVRNFLTVAQRDLRSTPEGWQAVRQVLVSVQPALADVDLSQAYTPRYLDELHQLGLDAAVGVPGP